MERFCIFGQGSFQSWHNHYGVVTCEAIGKGTYGEVRAIVDRLGRRSAVKTTKCDPVQGISAAFIREADTMQSFHHKNLMSMLDATLEPVNDLVSIRMELGSCNLHEYIAQTCFRERVNKFVVLAYSMLSGLAELHRKNISHNDIKPMNIIVTDDAFVLGDYGLCSYFYAGDYPIYTSNYRAPELFGDKMHDNRTYTHATDIWALGCTLAEYLIGCTLFKFVEVKDLSALANIFGVLGLEDDNRVDGIDPKFLTTKTPGPGVEEYIRRKCRWSATRSTCLHDSILSLISSMLQINPRRRKTCEDLLKHPLFENLAMTTLSFNQSHSEEFVPTGNYLNSPNAFFKPDDRQLVISWIIDLCVFIRVGSRVTFTAIYLFDSYIQKICVQQPVQRNLLQLIACAAHLISCKFHHSLNLNLVQYEACTQGAVTKADLKLMECKMLVQMQFLVGRNTPLQILKNQQWIGIITKQQFKKAKASLLACSVEPTFLSKSYADLANDALA